MNTKLLQYLCTNVITLGFYFSCAIHTTGAHASGSLAYTPGIPQCVTSFYERGDLWFVNHCATKVAVKFTSDSGRAGGRVEIEPGKKELVESMDIGYDPKRDGKVYLYTCPFGSDAVGMPGRVIFLPDNYKGQYSCLKEGGDPNAKSGATALSTYSVAKGIGSTASAQTEAASTRTPSVVHFDALALDQMNSQSVDSRLTVQAITGTWTCTIKSLNPSNGQPMQGPTINLFVKADGSVRMGTTEGHYQIDRESVAFYDALAAVWKLPASDWSSFTTINPTSPGGLDHLELRMFFDNDATDNTRAHVQVWADNGSQMFPESDYSCVHM